MTIFYHVDRMGTVLEPGKIIDLNYNAENLFRNTDRFRHFVDMFPDGVSYHGHRYLLATTEMLPENDSSGMIELLAEYIRQVHYGNRFSRLQSFFAFKTLEEANRFVGMFPSKSEMPKYNIWEVECDNQEFVSDMRRLNLGKCWLDASLNLHNYWRGVYTDKPIEEVLLRPPVKILRKINGLTIDENSVVTDDII